MKPETVVSVVACSSYDLGGVRRAVTEALAPLGGMERFVRPGMRVLLKPNLLSAIQPERAVTTHPTVVRAVAEQVRQAGGMVWIGDSPSGHFDYAHVWRRSGMAEAAERAGGELLPFDVAAWKRLDDRDYFIARPVLEADLIINLPKLKTHILTLYTGAVKNLFGTIPGTRKREAHVRAPGMPDFSRVLVDVLALVRPALTIMDGVVGLEGNGPGAGGTIHRYGCLATSTDAVALDAVLSQAMGFRPGEVLHLAQAGERDLGLADPTAVRVVGEPRALDFGPLDLPRPHWYFHVPGWVSAPLQPLVRLRPRLNEQACIGCGRCVEACPRQTITAGHPPVFDLDRCIGCMCCAEVCPQGAIAPRRNLLARLIGLG